ncbi:hypothetical protein mRhiFer1_010289 [Rhinolophus ferrumequinum]|uniref:Uncharacterized protein n=1 Tax=Rhinolophus ferrumequinum TaxID=59479 RepID=A0A7J7X5G3_RHIFE|nr:hypothetical protein mRhiFer1_010289 [Rhinolophus ferrumequinum]
MPLKGEGDNVVSLQLFKKIERKMDMFATPKILKPPDRREIHSYVGSEESQAFETVQLCLQRKAAARVGDDHGNLTKRSLASTKKARCPQPMPKSSPVFPVHQCFSKFHMHANQLEVLLGQGQRTVCLISSRERQVCWSSFNTLSNKVGLCCQDNLLLYNCDHVTIVDLNKSSTQRRIRRAKEHMKRCPTSVVIRGL